MEESLNFTEMQMAMLRLSRLERTMHFIFSHNGSKLKLPTEEEMGQINLASIDDAKKGKPATL